ncbi:MAG: hypothetical protein OXC44_01045 [Proteobacteria bacterium]|nr:hypothetical protein [Pseudomonadota bacterium]
MPTASKHTKKHNSRRITKKVAKMVGNKHIPSNNDKKSASPTTNPSVLLEQELVECLKETTMDYLAQSSVRSVAFLARKSGLPYSTVRRFVQGTSVPDFATVVDLLAVITDREGFVAFIKRFYPEHYQFLETSFATTGETFVDTELMTHFSDMVTNQILHMCATKSGTTEERVCEKFGTNGVNKLVALMEKGYVEKDEGKLFFYQESFSRFSLEMAIRNVELQTKIFDTNNLTSHAALLNVSSASVSLEGLKKIKGAAMHYAKKIASIRDSHSGDIPYFVTYLHNIYDNAPYEKSTQRLREYGSDDD